MASNEKFKLKHVAAALEKASGISGKAADILAEATGRGCSARTVRNYLKRYPELQRTIDETVETALDLAECKLLEAVDRGDKWAVRFYLETKGKNRGYTRRHEISGIGGRPIEVNDARERLIATLEQMGERLHATGADGPVAGRSNGHEAPRQIGNGAGQDHPQDPVRH